MKFEFTRCIRKINMDDFSVDSITPNMSLPDLNRHLSEVLDKHAPVCQLKVRQRGPSPWYSWRSSRLSIHKQLYV